MIRLKATIIHLKTAFIHKAGDDTVSQIGR